VRQPRSASRSAPHIAAARTISAGRSTRI
jgi:hypothetical protein